ncbi:MAG TPA: class II glutamine amidotransferase, partial [Actinomycetes bacterium]|nr:class II glutamine amidotransferase [Actinomycetes bacterium]
WGFRSRASAGHDRCSISLRKLHPELVYLNEASDEARLVVSEPLGELEGAWNEVPEATWGIVRPNGDAEMHSFHPAEAARLL